MRTSIRSGVSLHQTRLCSAAVGLLLVPVTAGAQADIILVGAALHCGFSATTRRSGCAEGDRIQGVGSEREIRALVGPRTKVVDLRGRTVLPGLIDAHVHVLGMAADDAALRQRMTGELPSNLRRFLQHGITSIRSTGDPMPYIIELRSRFNAGELPGPRLGVTGATITSQNGHPASTLGPTNLFCRSAAVRELTDPDSARSVVRDYVKAGVNQINMVEASQALT